MRDYIVQSHPISDDQKLFLKKKCLKFIIESGQPFYILENEGFKEFVLALNSFFEIPTEEFLDSLLTGFFNKGRDELKILFEKIDKISLTCDFWTSRG